MPSPTQEEDKLNPGQSDYDQKFNDTASTLNDVEKNGDAYAKSNDTSVDDLEKSFNAPSYKNNFTGMGAKKTSNGTLTWAKKRSPLIGIIIAVIGGAIGVGGLLGSPALLFEQIENTFTSALDNVSPAVSLRSRLIFKLKIDSVKNGFAESSSGACNIRCKFGTISESMKDTFDDPTNKFSIDAVESADSPGRYIIKNITFPDGTVVSTGDEFTTAMKDPLKAADLYRIYNPKSAPYLSSRFSEILQDDFNLDKQEKVTGETPEEVDESLRQDLGLEGDSAADDPLNALTPAEKVTEDPAAKPLVAAEDVGVGKLSGKVSNVLAGACFAYDTARDITYADDVAKIAAFTSFALVFLNFAGQVEANGGNSAVASQLGGQLTDVQTNPKNADGTTNAFQGKAATDSTGYHLASGESTAPLSTQDQTYAAAPLGALALIATFIAYVNINKKAGPAVEAAIHTVCATATSPGATIAQCLPEAAGGAVDAGVGAAVALIGCVGVQAATGFVTGDVISLALPKLVQGIVATDLPELSEETIGAAAGDAIYTGTAQMLGAEAGGIGMEAGTSSQIAAYAVDTSQIQSQNDQIARLDAASDPLDAANQYSFLGSIAQTIQLGSFSDTSFMSRLGSLLSIVPESFSSLTSTAGAQAVVNASNYGTCSDISLKNIGVDADEFCNPSYVMNDTELTMDPATNLEYMMSNDLIDINDGTPVQGTTAIQTDYQNYVKYCTNRTAPLGQDDGSISDANYDWELGIRCQDDTTEMDNFRVYTMDNEINNEMDGDNSSTATPAAQSAYSNSIVTAFAPPSTTTKTATKQNVIEKTANSVGKITNTIANNFFGFLQLGTGIKRQYQ
jgi:hypothetical protein